MAAPRISLLAFAGLAWCGCGGGGSSSSPTNPGAPQASPTPIPGPPGPVRFTVDSQTVVRGPSLAPTARNSFRLELPASSVTTVVLER